MSEKSQSNAISSAPKRPPKLGNVQTIVRNEDMFKTNKPTQFDEITLSDDDEDLEPKQKQAKCPTCSRDMTLWSTSRKDVHTKVCKQHEEEKKRKSKKKLTETIEKNDKVRFVEPKQPKSPEKSWEVSKNNVKFARIEADDEANRRRKRPRSFAVVELAPKKCQCEVVTTLHSRFMDEFHFQSLKNRSEKAEGLSEHAFQMSRMIEKLNRFEQLSSDMQKVFEDITDPTPSHFVIKCTDGEVKCHKLTVKHRTTLLRMHPSGEVICEKSREAVRSWLAYVYTARMEWIEDQVEEVLELAVKYGPVGLENAIKDSKRRESPAPEVIKTAEIPVGSDVISAPAIPEDIEKPVEPVEEEPDVYASDDPFVGFGKAVEEPELEPEPATEPEASLNDQDMMEEVGTSSFIASTPPRASNNSTMDSFDEWSNPIQQNTDLHSRSRSSPAFTINTRTPVQNASKPVFGSHVKILKTNDVTPMPAFDQMDEAELKERMKEIGMRPKGKKAMIQMLKKAYTTLHPEVCPGTPTIRPLIRENDEEAEPAKQKTGRVKKTLSERLASPKKLPKVREEEEFEESLEENEGDKTLNVSNDERDIGRICGDNVVGDDEEEEPGPSTGKNDLDGLRKSFLAWLRDPPNIVLYEHILSLQPVSLEEMLVRLEKADGPLGRIGKARLAKLLELLKITYQLPQKNAARRKIGGRSKF